jgi:hypothetical protein
VFGVDLDNPVVGALLRLQVFQLDEKGEDVHATVRDRDARHICEKRSETMCDVLCTTRIPNERHNQRLVPIEKFQNVG